jgi:hypothetical protein
LKLYEYKNFLEIEKKELAIELPADFEKFFDPAAMKKARFLNKQLKPDTSDLKGSDLDGLDGITSQKIIRDYDDNIEGSITAENLTIPPSNIGYQSMGAESLTSDIKKLKKNETIKQAKRLFKNSENIIGSLEEGRRKKLDKSYALIL